MVTTSCFTASFTDQICDEIWPWNMWSVGIGKEDFCQFWGYVGCVDFGISIFSLKPPLMPDADRLSPLKSCLLGCCRFWCLCHGARYLFLSHEASDEHIERTVYRQSFGCSLAMLGPHLVQVGISWSLCSSHLDARSPIRFNEVAPEN